MAENDQNNSIETKLKNPEKNILKDQKKISNSNIIEYEIVYKNFNDDEKYLYFETESFLGMKFKGEIKLKIFDRIFIDNNEDKCEIIYKDKEYKLKEYLEDIDKDYINSSEKEIKIKLRINQDITNMSYMFHKCDRLLYVKNEQKLTYSNNNSLDFSRIHSEYNKSSEEDSKKGHLIENEKSNFFNNNSIEQDNSTPSSISLRTDNNTSD